VEFQPDTLRSTTGDGRFVLAPSSQATIDPPPHNRSYFEHQLLALANYYQSVSGRRLILQSTVMPEGQNDSYRLPQPMVYYNPGGQDEQLLDRRLAELFRDGLQAASASGGIEFSQYQSFIIFHAGVGSDFQFDPDPTPNDIPSAFLDFATLKRTLGAGDPTFEGIPVHNGTFHIREGIILPETQSQEGFEIGLLGTAALMLGHQLGLPNLFNTDTGRPGIGKWGLMDQGSGNFSGLLPAPPEAWSKVFLGWEEPLEVKHGQGIALAAALAANPNKVIKVPISAKEYFLLENRQRDVNRDGVAVGRDANGVKVIFKPDETLEAGAPIGVITEVDEYDFGLPGSGILIWHVDESVIEARYAENRVNADPDHRGVDLEEADGAQDIGRAYGFLDPGFGTESGAPEDAFWAGNDIHKLVNASNDVAFTPNTFPNSRSYSGANSHVFITKFSDLDSVMQVDVRLELAVPGFPSRVGQAEASITNSPAFGDFDFDGYPEVFFASPGGTVSALSVGGAVRVLVDVSGQLSLQPAFKFFTTGSRRQWVIVTVTDDGRIIFSRRDGENRVETATPAAPSLDNGIVDWVSAIRVAPLIVDSLAYVGDEAGLLQAFDSRGGIVGLRMLHIPIRGLAQFRNTVLAATADGRVLTPFAAADTIPLIRLGGAPSGSPAVGDLDADGAEDFVITSENGEIGLYWGAGQTKVITTTARFFTSPSLGDIDNDGFLDVITASSTRLYAFNRTGALLEGFPVELPAGDTPVRSSPIIGDIDGDARPEIILGTPANQVVAFRGDGRPVEGFPLPTGGAVNSTPALGDLDGDGDAEVAVACDDGFLYVWDLPGRYDPENIPWGSYLHDPQHTSNNPQRLQPKPPTSPELMPAHSVYNYPNPTEGNVTTIRYRLNFAANVKIRIFDLAGELVDEFSGPGLPQTDNEVIWRLDRVQSGVYLARVQAEGEGKKSVAIVKIAVVK